MKSLICIGLLLACSASLAFYSRAEIPNAMSVRMGSAQSSGYLWENHSFVDSGLALIMSSGGGYYKLSMDFPSSAPYKGLGYNFSNNSTVYVRPFVFSIHPVFPINDKWSAEVGIGFGVFSITSSDDKSYTDYGGWRYEAGAIYHASEKVRIHLSSSYSEITNTISDSSRFLGYWSNSIELAYAFDFLNGR